jgi:hypothetical protein
VQEPTHQGPEGSTGEDVQLFCIAQIERADADGGTQPEAADATAEGTSESIPAAQPNLRERLVSLLAILKELFLFSADSSERKQGIRRLYFEHHPDKNQDDIEESTVRCAALCVSSNYA